MTDISLEVEDPHIAFESLDFYAYAPSHYALFFDFDGTLIDFADNPDEVIVPPSLLRNMKILKTAYNDAIAIISGRNAASIAAMTDNLFPVAGLHGAEVYPNIDRLITDPEIPVLQQAKFYVEHYLSHAPEKFKNVILEDKTQAFAVHFRQCPQCEADLSALMKKIIRLCGPSWKLQYGKNVIEICPSHADKGKALKNFMLLPVFSGRVPLVFGDDLTDESMFKAANALNGISVKVGQSNTPTYADFSLKAPCDLRKWIENAAQFYLQSVPMAGVH